MNPILKARQTGKTVILCALVLRMCAAGMPGRVIRWARDPKVISFLIYLETGRTVRSSVSSPEPARKLKAVSPPEIPAPRQSPARAEPPLPCFTSRDLAAVSVADSSGENPDLEALLTQPLHLSLAGEEPTVLILHTHATESYTPAPGEEYPESAAFRTLEEGANMLAVGDRVTELLEAGGIRVIHDRALHDYPSYNSAYSHARKAIREQLEHAPAIQLVLDLHRDAAGNAKNQLRTNALCSKGSCAQLMLVLGTGNAGAPHSRWQQNLALGLKLTAQLERQCPGITRPISLRPQRFNQDLSPGALLVEVGAAGNTRQEALLAAEQLADAILALKNGSAES